MHESRESWTADDLVADLIDEFTAELERGGDPEIEAFTERLPDHAERIRRTLNIVRALQRLEAKPPATPSEQGGLSGAIQAVGEFQLVREIGRGGMGVVFEARQLSFNRSVALKILPFAALANPRSLERFRNEVRAAGCLHHPNIVPIYSVGVERGTHYFAMQLIDGPSLGDVLDELRRSAVKSGEKSGHEQPLPTQRATTNENVRVEISTLWQGFRKDYYRQAATWCSRAADALSYAHEAGVLHRDVKPGNLLLDEQHQVWVADFGLARVQTEASMTQTGDLIGTLRYASPEQALGRRELIDHRADVYSLGATLYELLTLQPVFATENRERLLQRIADEEPRTPNDIVEDVPADLATIAMKALQKQPASRYQTAQEMSADLERFLHHQPILAKPPTIGERAAKWAARNNRQLEGGAAACVLFVVFAVAGLAYHTRELSAANDGLEQVNADLAKSYEETRALLYLTDMQHAFQAWDRGNLKELRELLDRQRPSGSQIDLRGLEWRLLNGLADPLEPMVFQAGNAPLRELALVPDKEEFVTVGDDGVIRHWSIAENALLRALSTEAEELHAVAVSPDGRWLATGNPTLELWDFATGEKVRDLATADTTLESVIFSPDGTTIAAGWRYGEIHVVSLTGELQARIPATGVRNETIAFLPSGEQLIVPCFVDDDFVIRRFDIDSPSTAFDLEGRSLEWNRLAVATDGLVTAGVPYAGATVRFIENDSSTVIGEIYQGSQTIRSLGFSPRGDRLAWGTDDGDLCVFSHKHKWYSNLSHNSHLPAPRTMSAHFGRVTDVKCLEGGQTLTCGEDGLAKLWRQAVSERMVSLKTPAQSCTLIFSPDGEKIVVPGEDGQIWVADADDGEGLATLHLDENSASLSKIAYFPDGSRFLVGDDLGGLTAIHAESHHVVTAWTPETRSRITSVAVSPDQSIAASAASNQSIRIHDAESLSVTKTISFEENINALAFSADGGVLAWGGEARGVSLCPVGLWDQAVMVPTRSRCDCLAFAHHSNLLATGHTNGMIQIIDATSGDVVRQRATDNSSSAQVQSIAWSQDDRLLVTTHRDGTQRLWHAPTATEFGVLYREGMLFSTTCFSPVGDRLAAFFELGDASQGILWKLDD